MKTNTKKGFTLIEILIAFTVVVALAGVIFASINSVKKKSYDKTRIADIEQLQLVLKVYRGTYDKYPDTDTGDDGSLNALAVLAPTYISKLPTDPISSGPQTWNGTASTESYYYWNAGDTPFIDDCNADEYILIYYLQDDTTGTASNCLTGLSGNWHAIVK